ncbi:MAG: ABC transporter permease [Kofleriaceae bacterium]
MTARVLRRVAWAAAVAWFAITVTFLILRAVPGDPARLIVGPHAGVEELARARAAHGLDDSLIVQYARYVGHVVQGELGESFRSQRPVREILAAHAWPTFQLLGAAILLQLALGVPLGLAAARWSDRWPDRAITGGALLALSAPPFVVGALLFYLAGYRWDLLPISGYGEPGLDRLAHLVLPALAQALPGAAATAQLLRAELRGALARDFIRTARAKGVPERAVLGRHALRPSLPPIVAAVSVDVGVLVTGAVVVESLFGWPGLGREALLAVLELDMPVVLGVVLLSSVVIAAIMLLADLANLALDPRTRRER